MTREQVFVALCKASELRGSHITIIYREKMWKDDNGPLMTVETTSKGTNWACCRTSLCIKPECGDDSESGGDLVKVRYDCIFDIVVSWKASGEEMIGVHLPC